MLNEILHRLTNKARDSSIPGFPTDSRFTPTVTDSNEEEVRKVLKVNDNPYYLYSCIQLIHTYPELLSALGERHRTLNPGRLPFDSPTVAGASLVKDDSGEGPVFHRQAREWPIRFSLTYSYLEPGLLVSDYMSANVPYTINGSGNLEPDWPVWSGVSGAVDVDNGVSGIQPGDSFTITQNPVVFPSSRLVDKLMLVRELVAVLRKTALLNHFHWAESDDERVAVTAAALCLYNKITNT